MDSCTLFEEDEIYVYTEGKGCKFGLVLENAEYYSSEDEENPDKDDTDDPERLKKGNIRVAWHPSGKETVVQEDKVSLCDRSLMPGDVVRRHLPGQDTQCGFVMDMEVLSHLHILRTNKYIYNVNSRDLKPILKFGSGLEVILDLWWGKIETVTSNVDLLFPDGARCRVDENELAGAFEDISEKQRTGEFSMLPFYPGEELRGRMSNLSMAKWLVATPRYCHRVANKCSHSQMVTVTVEKIEAVSVEVHWVFGGSNGMENTPNPPPRIIEGDNLKKLKLLDWFDHCSLQIGDRLFYRIKNDDKPVTLEPKKAFNPKEPMTNKAEISINCDAIGDEAKNREVNCMEASPAGDHAPAEDDAEYEDVDTSDDSDLETDKPQAVASRRGGKKKKSYKPFHPRFKVRGPAAQKPPPRRPRKERSVEADTVVEAETAFTTSWAKVMWQDGSIETMIPSVHLFPVHHLDELEFFPGDFVLPGNELPDLKKQPDYGVVVTADHAERTVLVHWFAVYDAGKAGPESNQVKEMRPELLAANCEVSVYDLKDHPDYKFRPGLSVVPVGSHREAKSSDSNGFSACQTVGQIFELDPSGSLMIKWCDGSISRRYPQEVFVVSDEVDEDDDEEEWQDASDFESNGSSGDESWETESEHSVEIGEDGAAKLEDSGVDAGVLAGHQGEIDALLTRASTALSRLQKLINEFDSSVSAPECFQDIVKIYRNCQELDKILKSNFFSDPELQKLISQAKAEIKKDKNNKISKHLTQLFESWSKTVPNAAMSGNLFNLVDADGKTRTFGSGESSDVAKSFENKTQKDNEEDKADQAISSGPENASNASKPEEGKVLKKEYSAPVLGTEAECDLGAAARRPSDPLADPMNSAVCEDAKKLEASLVGENCVAKASKRTKSDGFEECVHEAKKSREDSKDIDAHELCSKICKCLKKQIVLIHEDMNKRALKMINVLKKEKQSLEESIASTDDNAAKLKNLIKMSESLISNGENSEETTPEATPSLAEASQPEKTSDTEKDAAVEADSKAEEVAKKEDMVDDPSKDVTALTDQIADVNVASEELINDLSSPLSETSLADEPCKGFQMTSEAPQSHNFIKKQSQPSNPRSFRTAIKKELKLFQTSLPDGIFVQGFEDRLDLFSVMILGPEGTPYEDALFLFDFWLPNDYPSSPPVCHYHSYCKDRLNPNLYEDGKVCVSLLGTWSGRGNEVWTSKSNLLQVLISIQGLILVREPYYNEAGFERQRGTQVGLENSRVYNEMAILKTCQALTKLSQRLPSVFAADIHRFLLCHGPRFLARLQHWLEQNLSRRDSPAKASPPSQPAQPPHDPSASSEGDSQGAAAAANLVSMESSEKERMETGGSQEEPCSNQKDSDPCADNAAPSQPKTTENRLESTASVSDERMEKPKDLVNESGVKPPEYPLFPISRGFCMTLKTHLGLYRKALEQLASQDPPPQ